MSKAFDSVDHQILLRKLQDVSASASVLQWFNSYFTNRYQVVRIHSTVSDPILIEYGVPQGSILGPLLFSINVNDLPEAPRNCSTECYVDDTKLFVSFHSQDTQRIVEEMNEDSAKDLGVILDSNLTFDDHIKTTVSECIARLAQISPAKHCLDRTSLLTVINVLVFSTEVVLLLERLGKYHREKYTEIAGCAELRMSNRQWREKVR